MSNAIYWKIRKISMNNNSCDDDFYDEIKSALKQVNINKIKLAHDNNTVSISKMFFVWKSITSSTFAFNHEQVTR